MAHHADDTYYVPHGTKWPIIGSLGLITMLSSAAFWMNDSEIAPWTTLLGALILIYMLFGWFGEVIRESEAGMYNAQVDTSFRMGMMWFIFSEVMFFACFFGVLFYVRMFSVPWLGGEGTGASTNELLWQGYDAVWPTAGPAEIGGSFQTVPAFGVPFINTLILLSSGFTVTMAHHALRKDGRGKLVAWLIATVVLGFLFVYLQIEEYKEAYQHMHVTLGAIMLTVITIRAIRGHFTPQHHFGFEAVAWYWHFVDVVWLGLFIFVYVY